MSGPAPAARAFVVQGPSEFQLQEFPLPRIGDDEGLLQVLVAGVDGTDVRYLRGESGRHASYPFIGGDEIVGRVVEIGAGAARRWNVRRGDVVAVEPHLACGACGWCRRGSSQFCASKRGYGVRVPSTTPPHLWGAFAEYLFLPPQATVAPLGDLHPEVGILVPSMLANGIRWVTGVGRVRPGDRVVILGAGQQALGCTVAAAEAGAEAVVVSGLPGDEARLRMAHRLGATGTVDASGEALRAVVKETTGGAGADVVIDVTGSPRGLETALAVVARGGRVVVAGLSRSAVTLTPDDLVWNEVAILGAYSHDVDSFVRAVRLARKRSEDLRAVVSDRYSLSQTAEAVFSLDPPPCGTRPVKAVVEPFPDDRSLAGARDGQPAAGGGR